MYSIILSCSPFSYWLSDQHHERTVNRSTYSGVDTLYIGLVLAKGALCLKGYWECSNFWMPPEHNTKKCWELLDQGSAYCSLRAGCGPLPGFIWPLGCYSFHWHQDCGTIPPTNTRDWRREWRDWRRKQHTKIEDGMESWPVLQH